MFAKFEKFLDELRNTPLPGNDCIVCHKGKVVFRHFGGFADREKKLPMTGKERFQIFSCSKLMDVAP